MTDNHSQGVRKHSLNSHAPSNHKKDILYLLLLIGIAVVSHIIWFTPGVNLFHSDWSHWPDAATRQAWELEGSWKNFLDFGSPNIQVGYFFVTGLWPLIAFLGGGFDAAVKFTVMIPIAILGFIAPYIFLRKFITDHFISFVGALFYASTTYFLLRQGAHLQIAFIYALSPLIFTFLINALRNMTARNWIVFGLAYAVGLCYEVRIMFILSFILGLYAVIFYLKKSNLKPLLKVLPVLGFVVIALSAFWLLPTIFGGTQSEITERTSRSLFGSYLFDLPHAITLSSSAWTGGVPNETFTMQPVKPYLWLIPLIVIIPLAIRTRLSPLRRKQVLFFAIVALVGIFLTKQVLDPLPQAYPWLYTHFPGFSLFREASKFYLLTAWGYLGLLCLGLIGLRSLNPNIFRFVAAIPIVIAGINLFPLISGNFGTLFVARHIPHDYVLLNQKIAESPSMSRTLWVPSDSEWGHFDKLHPKVSLISVMQGPWSPLVDEGSLHQKVTSLFKKPYTKELLEFASVKFVVVPLRDIANEDDFIRYYGDDRQFYVDVLDNVPWLKRIDLGTKQVAVYENQNYRQYIDSATDLYKLPSLANLEEVYALNEGALKKNFNFALNDEKQVAHGTEVRDIFSGLKASNISNGKIAKQATSKQPVLYANAIKSGVSYKVANKTLDLYTTQPSGIRINGQIVGSERNSTVKIGAATLDPKRRYYVAIGDHLTLLNTQKDKERSLGAATGPVRLLSTDATNLVPNASFEKGLWQKKVEDCNAYDQQAEIYMDISTAARTQGKNSLELTALSHAACTGPDAIAVEAGQEYLLSFDYRAEDADEISYQLVFNDPQRTTIKQYVEVGNEGWHTIRYPMTVPEGATKLEVKLIGIPNTKTLEPTTTNYDNVGLARLATDISTQFDLTPQYKTTLLEAKNNRFEYVDPTYSPKNLIPNPSFEQGTWQKVVGDCNAYDDEPQLRMSTSDTASAGKKSLELAAKRHIACTGTKAIPVKENTTYLLSFDTQSPNAQSASYYIRFDDPSRTATTGSVPATENWQNFSHVLRTPSEAHNLELSVYAKSGSNGSAYIINRYDNFKLIEVPDIQNQYYLVDSPDKQLTAPEKVDLAFVNPTKKLVHIQKTKGPFYLTMNEAYHPQWRLELNNRKATGLLNSWSPKAKPDAVAQRDHIKWDNFVNGWYVDPTKICKGDKAGCTRHSDGSYDMNMIIEFAPQRWFYVGVAISATSLLAVVAYLLYTRFRPSPEAEEGHWKWRGRKVL